MRDFSATITQDVGRALRHGSGTPSRTSAVSPASVTPAATSQAPVMSSAMTPSSTVIAPSSRRSPLARTGSRTARRPARRSRGCRRCRGPRWQEGAVAPSFVPSASSTTRVGLLGEDALDGGIQHVRAPQTVVVHGGRREQCHVAADAAQRRLGQRTREAAGVGLVVAAGRDETRGDRRASGLDDRQRVRDDRAAVQQRRDGGDGGAGIERDRRGARDDVGGDSGDRALLRGSDAVAPLEGPLPRWRWSLRRRPCGRPRRPRAARRSRRIVISETPMRSAACRPTTT